MGVLSYFDHQYSYLRRYNQIIRVLFKYGFEDIVSYMEEKKRFSFLKRFIPKRTLEQSLHLTKWEKMRLVCEELGPSFVKFGQIMSNRPDLLPSDLITELEKLQDTVPPFPGAIAVQMIEQQLNARITDIFKDFETKAFASASIAQVHKATLKTGENVVVKIQRPGIQQTIISDIRVMRYVAEVLVKRIPSLKHFDPIGLINNFEDSINKELDFIHESVNVQRFRINFTQDETNEGHIECPAVYPEFTTSTILTLQFINGIKISKLSDLKSGGYDPKVIAKRLAVSFAKQVFKYGFFHADPHAGNLLIMPNNIVCYIDFGMMGSIMKKDLEQLSNLFLSINTKDVKKIIRALMQLSDTITVSNYRAFESDITEFVNNYSIREVHKNEMSTILLQLKDVIIKHDLKVPTHFFLLAKALVSLEGVIRQLDPTLDLTRIVRPYLIKMIARNYNPLLFAKRVFNSVYEMGMYMEEFPRDLKNAMRKINSGEMKVELNHKGIDPITHTINRVSRQIVSAVIISALIIGSSLLIVAGTPPKWNNTSEWGIIGFIVAIIIGMKMYNNLSKGDNDGA